MRRSGVGTLPNIRSPSLKQAHVTTPGWLRSSACSMEASRLGLSPPWSRPRPALNIRPSRYGGSGYFADPGPGDGTMARASRITAPERLDSSDGAAGDLGEQEHFAVRSDWLEERVLVDLPVDGHRDPLFEV